MGKVFDKEMQTLRNYIMEMSTIVESMISGTIDGLVSRDSKNFPEIRQKEKRVNQIEMQIDDIAWKMIALRQPMGMDLRFILTAIKVNPLLERIGDEAINILNKAEDLLNVPLLKPLIDTPRMAEKAAKALHLSIEALFEGNTNLAREICIDDKEIDDLRDQIYRELLTYMQDSYENIQRAIKLIFIAKSLERIGDIATDIAEDAIYLHEGKDIRHHAESDEEFFKAKKKKKADK
ncbi:MAG: phosphate signaling complex protein PhoU [Candidatus Brocadiae bacterium]|nr:phosphate signaling complex protein PhoU [Candidatus Brocadiia bacterium]